MYVSLDISALVTALSWPVAIFAIVYVLRKPLTELLRSSAEVRVEGLGMNFGFRRLFEDKLQGAEEAAQEVGLPQPPEEEGTTAPQVSLSEELLPLYDLAGQDPRTAILEAWTVVERELRDQAIKKVGRGAGVSSRGKLLNALAEHPDLFPPRISYMASQLYDVRSTVIYSGRDFVVRPTEAINYLNLAGRLLNYVRRESEQAPPG